MNEKRLTDVLIEILRERARQDSIWGEQNHSPLEWLAILGEERGEVDRAVCEAHFPNYPSCGDWSKYRQELIQEAAVCAAMIECLDRAKESDHGKR